MGEYITVNGHPTWFDRSGSGDPVLLLHGAFSNRDGRLGVLAGLADDFELAASDRRGHGRTADTDAPTTIRCRRQDRGDADERTCAGRRRSRAHHAADTRARRRRL
jgi:pimeloyl-ACP methyl ester carboxylesterase